MPNARESRSVATPARDADEVSMGERYMRQQRGTALLACLVLAGIGLLGCGNDPPATPGIEESSADEILSKARAAAKAASSFRMAGEVREQGDAVALDLQFLKDKGVTGKVTVQGMTFEVLVVDQTAYLKADRATWEKAGAGQGAQILVGKYIKLSSNTSGFGQIMEVADPQKLLDQALTPEGKVVKTTVKEVNGVSAIGLADQEDTKDGTLYVATEGEPYPVRVESASGQGSVDFSGWNDPVELTAPPADQVISFEDLQDAAA